MVNYASYPEYAPTQIERLPDIPTNWHIAQLRRLLKEPLANGIFKKREHWGSGTKIVNVFDAYAQGDLVDESSLDRVSCDASEQKKYAVCHGDFVFVRSSLKLEGVGKSASILNPSEQMIFECHLVRGRPDLEVVEPKYLCYFLNSSYSRQSLIALSNQVTMATIDQEKFKSLSVAIPSIEEQQTIARFLDFKTAQIDALIAKQKTLLEKLAEKRTALISHAVTKGLDPAVPMKDSGVAWLGEIPAHWDIWKVTHGFGKIGSGTTPKSDNPLFYDGEIPWVTTSELRESVIFDTAQKVTGEAVAMHSALKVYPAGSLAIAMYGATIGRLGILGIDATFNQACCVFSDPLVFDTQFVYYWLWMRRPILISLSNGGGQPNLSQDDLKKLWIPIPDLNEQRDVVRFLDGKTSVVDEQVKKVEEVIVRLSEYRSALITNAVTGKIDVRGFQVPENNTQQEVTHA